ncbi:MAG TPA: hypothetical protein DDW76_32745 [Cyanobacteria bacterium UBA11369]|nr:hypothetical protein [Cyanobacteria bacterium UBA11371]HBE31918.1 hypothetical protein [Cyanobacteria bacterium UBA11368]HBE53398.1 hypothetical protein [Cyanobacteria bacterium UBA11369]
MVNQHLKEPYTCFPLDVSNGFTIVSPIPEDIPPMSDLLKFVWGQTFKQFLSDQPAKLLFSEERIKQWIEASNGYVGLVKYLGEIVGVISAFQDKDTIHISHLYIHPDFQNKGLGSKMIDSVLVRFPSVKKLSLRVFEKNTHAIKFYQNKGFCEVSIRDANFGTEKTPSILMEKPVD